MRNVLKTNDFPDRSSRFFTLIELLVVIAIIAILASMLLPALSRARYTARNVLCIGNLDQLTMAAFIYADDYNERYPDRGVNNANPSSSTFTMYARWGPRYTYDKSNNSGAYHRNLLRLMHDYCPTDTGVWVCPLYRGTHYGTPGVGIKDFKTVDATMTYGLMAATGKWKGSGWWVGQNDRVKVGDKFEVVDGTGNEDDLSFLWYEAGLDRMNMFTPGTYMNTIGTAHSPPPGSEYVYNNNDIPRAELKVVSGVARTTWSFDDGSVQSKRMNLLYTSNADWIVYRYQPNGRMPYFPREE